MKNYKELLNYLNNEYLRAFRKERKCLHPDCSWTVSNNHCVPEALLRKLAIDGHLFEIYFNPWKPEVSLKKIGVDNCMIFRLLCGAHDNQYFKKTDQSLFEIDNYENVLQLNHRALLNELFKKTIRNESYLNFSREYSDIKSAGVLRAKKVSESYKFNFESLSWYLNNIYTKVDREFIYKVYKYPFIEVATNELFTYEASHISQSKRDMYRNIGILKAFSELFINIIPRKEDEATYLVISSHANDQSNLDEYCEKFIDEKLSKKFSDMLLLHLENWTCSKNFYEMFIAGKINFDTIFNATSDLDAYSRQTGYNIFNKVQM